MSENTANENQEAVKEEASNNGFPLDCVYAVKEGMTRVFTEDGDSIPVTVLSLKEGTFVTDVRTKGKNGYSALQLGFGPKKQQRANKAEIGHFKKSGNPGYKMVAELRLDKDAETTAGQQVDPSFLSDCKFVDVRSRSKGKGFQGVLKRWNFAGGIDSHGHSLSHRSGGSIGQNTSPARVVPGKKMAGHMGNRMQTTQNLKVISFDKEKNLVLLRGAVPGSKNAVVQITRSVKKG